MLIFPLTRGPGRFDRLSDRTLSFEAARRQILGLTQSERYTIRYVESKVVYLSNIHLERKKGPLRVAQLPGEANPVIFSVHDEIARHYGVDEKALKESHAATIDYVVAAAGG